jgi:hypothetical protein
MKPHKMTEKEFRSWYIEVGQKAAMRLAVCNGVSYSEVQIWVAKLENGIHHLVFNG